MLIAFQQCILLVQIRFPLDGWQSAKLQSCCCCEKLHHGRRFRLTDPDFAAEAAGD